MPLLLRCEESSPVVINNFFFFLYSRTFSNVRANQTQHDRSLGEKKNPSSSEGRKEEWTYHEYSCGWRAQWLLFHRTVSSGKTVCKKRDGWKGKLFKHFFPVPPWNFQTLMSQINNGQGSVCPQVTRKIPTPTLFFTPVYFFPPVSKFVQKSIFFSVWSDAQQNGKQTEPSLHRPKHTSAF